jgi:hypothetical protein
LPGAIALEAGNSPRMVFSNYRELVRTADAEKSFGITPETVEAVKIAREKLQRIRLCLSGLRRRRKGERNFDGDVGLALWAKMRL